MPDLVSVEDEAAPVVCVERKRPANGIDFVFSEIDKDECKSIVRAGHYSGTCPGLMYCYGVYEDCSLVGVVGYSKPSSMTLCNGVCGREYTSHVIELSRLCVTTKTNNAASYLIARSLAALPDHVVVSYADCNDNVGHVGYVYQATNWLYTGQGNAEPIWVDPRSGDVVSYHRRHIHEKAEAVGLSWRDLVQVERVGKHRYVYFTGSKSFRKRARACLCYKVYKYPKGDTRRHDEVALKSRLD